MASTKSPSKRSATFAINSIRRLLESVALNPLFLFFVISISRLTRKGRELSTSYSSTLNALRILFYIRFVQTVNGYLSRKTINNWQSDRYVWSQEIVVVTGGSDGIGACVARILAGRGIKTVVLDIQPLAYTCPSNLTYIKCDIGSASSVAEAAARIRSSVGKPTVLVNNAGVFYGKRILDTSEAQVSNTFQVNIMGSFWATKEFLPDMVAKNHGMIVVTTSLAAHIPAAQCVPYAATKAAAVAFHDGLATEIRDCYKAPKIRTILITPGQVNTPMAAGIGDDSKFPGPVVEPETLAQEIVGKILEGRSTSLVIPKASSVFCSIKSWPSWLQAPISKEAGKAMKTYRGRTVDK